MPRSFIPNSRVVGSRGPLARIAKANYPFNDRPQWPYIGKDRQRFGKDVDTREFSIRNNPTAQQWRFDDQCWAIEQGFFFHRELVRNRVVIIGVNPYDPTFDYYKPTSTMVELYRRAFQCKHRYNRALDFIQQQDEFGYSGAWDDRVQCYTQKLDWYKLYIQSCGGVAGRMRKLRNHVAHARAIKQARHVARIINDDKDVDDDTWRDMWRKIGALQKPATQLISFGMPYAKWRAKRAAVQRKLDDLKWNAKTKRLAEAQKRKAEKAKRSIGQPPSLMI